MNKTIASPFIVNVIPPADKVGHVARNGRRAYVPTNTPWAEFTTAMAAIHNEDFDSVIVHVDGNLDLDAKGMAKNVTIKLNQICKMATEADKAVLNDASKDQWYWMNASYEDQSNGHGYAPDDATVRAKFNSFESEAKWQEHQSKIWHRMADMMPLSDGSYGPNHIAKLTDPSRGLEKQDLDEFWSFRSNTPLCPAVMGDDMIGMPGVVGVDYDGFTLIAGNGAQAGREIPLNVRSLKTIGMSGIAIPMANVDGNVPKYQIATDPSKINVMLKARTADGVSIQKSEYFDKKRNVFKFEQDGFKSNLHVVDAKADGTVIFGDRRGDFTAHMKDDVKPVLLDRGYQLPELIDRLQVVPNAKYIWQSKGSMVGTDAVCKKVSPSNAGFVIGREPKNGAEEYVVLVAEGALKGRIVAKYADVQDSTGRSFGDKIAKDYGIIVAQVPGVSKAFVESVKPVYDKYPVKGTYIAMDADGRENLAVARGIETAYDCLNQKNQTVVMSWNPDHKGLDDALLAVAQKKITIEDMGIQYGTPQELFPKNQATAPNPYRLDGSRANGQEWQVEYVNDKRMTDAKIKALQAETIRRAAEEAAKAKAVDTVAADLQQNGKDLLNNLPTDEPTNVPEP